LAYVFLTQLAIKWLFKFSPHAMSAFALPGEIRPNKIRVEMIKNVNKIRLLWYLWPPRASRLQDLTVVHQYVYQMTLKDVYKLRKRLVTSGLVWIITLSILLSMNGKIVSIFVIAQLANILINFIAGSWKAKQLDKVLAKLSKM